jgi:single-stranded DNA-binding protein
MIGGEMKMLGGKEDGGQRDAPAPAARQQAPEAKNGSPFDDMDDSIPF